MTLCSNALRSKALKYSFEVEGVKAFEIHGRGVVADKHQALEVIGALGFGDARKLTHIIEQMRFRK